MGVSYSEARQKIGDAAKKIFAADPRVHAVGIGSSSTGFHFRAVRNARKVLPLSAQIGSLPDFDSISVAYVDAPGEVFPHVKVPFGAVSQGPIQSSVIERARHRPLVCGLQIENFDQDKRSGEIAQGLITIGTLGCFVRTINGTTAILSNNHVVAGENSGAAGDRIVQPGTGDLQAGDVVASLGQFVVLNPSPANATPAQGNVVFNEVDCGLAELSAGVPFAQDFLRRQLPSPSGTASPALGDRVFKVGRTTGLTVGSVKDVHTIVGPIPYQPGLMWFQECFSIEGDSGAIFSDHGDSGSAILRDTGEVVGLLFAGNGQQTFACPIGTVLQRLQCTLV